MGTYVAAELGHDLEQRNLTEVAGLAGHVRASHDVEALGLAHVGVVSDHRSRIQVVEHRVFALLDRELDEEGKQGRSSAGRTTTAGESQRTSGPRRGERFIQGVSMRRSRVVAKLPFPKTVWSTESHR